MENPFLKYTPEQKEEIKEAILHSFASIKMENGEILDHYSRWYPVYLNELMPYVHGLSEEELAKNGFNRSRTYRNMILKLLTK